MTPIKAAAEPSGEALLALADEIEASEGLVKMQPLRAGPSQLGIKKTAQIVSALRRLAAPAGTTPKPFYGAECPAYPACDGGCGLGCTKEIERTHAAPPEASFDNASDMLGYLNAPREAGPVAWRPIETAPRDGTRLILAWDDIASLPMHWEVGRYRSGAGTGSGWCNTYGHPFSGEPTHWALPGYASPSPIPEAPTIDSVPSCGQENDYKRAQGSIPEAPGREEIAKIVESKMLQIPSTGTHAFYQRRVKELALETVDAIRALKPQDGGK